MQEKNGSTSPKSICISNDQMCVDVRTPMSGHQLKAMSLPVYEDAIKVARELADDGPGSVKAIDIPPPRAKRKPLHPYPRKLGHSSSMKKPVLEQPEWSSLSIPSTSEQENKSTTSVLTAFKSDKRGSPNSNHPSTSTSPVSSVAGANKFVMFLSDRMNGCQLPVTSTEEENRCPSPSSASTGFTTQDKSSMECTQESENHVPLEEDPSVEVQATSLKLFGRTVQVTDSQKSSSYSDGSSEQCCKPLRTDIKRQDRTMDMDIQAQAQSVPQSNRTWGPWPGGSGMPPVLFSLPSHGDPANDAAGVTVVPLPCWWAFCRNLPFQFTNLQNITSDQDPCKSYVEAADVFRNGSNTASAGDAGLTREPAPSSSLRPSTNSAFSRLNASASEPARGFVPYKRCLAGKAVQYSLAADEDRDCHQGIKLCS